MFSEGDLIVYGSTGVCRVQEITRTPAVKSLEDGRLYYVLDPLYVGGVIYTPAENPKVFMRPVISRAGAEELIDKIPSINAEVCHETNSRRLEEHYANAMSSHSCADLMEMTMSIYAKRTAARENRRRVGQVDERYMKRAEELLFGELAVALSIAKEDVPAYIADKVGDVLPN